MNYRQVIESAALVLLVAGIVALRGNRQAARMILLGGAIGLSLQLVLS